jgi:hypothetical protein
MRKRKIIDPTEIQVCGLGYIEIMTFATALKSFHGYTGEEQQLTGELNKVVEAACTRKHKSIDAREFSRPGSKLAAHIGAKTEILAMVMAWAYRTIEFEREAFKHSQSWQINQEKMDEILRKPDNRV